MQIIEADSVNRSILDQLNLLMPQLSTSAPDVTAVDLERIVASKNTTLLLAVEKSDLLGCLVLSVLPVLTDVRAWIDDLVVFKNARGKGVGRQLVSHAMQLAMSQGARSVNLTCHPDRLSANALYRRLGFQHRETNVYRYGL